MLQVHKYDPGVLVQVALAWHGVDVVHSLISEIKRKLVSPDNCL